MPRKESRLRQVVCQVSDKGLVRLKEMRELGFHCEYVRRLWKGGKLTKIARGVYSVPGLQLTENHSLAEVCKRVPRGVVCLLSALRFHGLTTQLPPQVWLAIDSKARAPKLDRPALRIVRFSGAVLSQGVEEHTVEGVTVRVFSVAKTIADCFKYRNKIGLDVALSALRDGYRERRFAMDDLWRYAKIDRVANVMRPYLDSLE